MLPPFALPKKPMTSTTREILIIGGNSAIARHLATLLPGARSIARTAGYPHVRSVGSYAGLRPADFDGIDLVINCAGIVTGDARTLKEVNVTLTHHLAATARAGGARRFVTIGSFSIFGPQSRIDRTTKPGPEDPYGASKLASEIVLQRLQRGDFSVLTVALPAIIGTTRVGKVERMIRAWQRIGIWPIPVSDVTRSLVGASSAAQILASAALQDHTGRLLAADPVPFRYRSVAKWLREDVGGHFGLLPLPARLTAPFARLAPRLHRSLMTDCHLADDSNFAVVAGVKTTLRADLSAILARRPVQ